MLVSKPFAMCLNELASVFLPEIRCFSQREGAGPSPDTPDTTTKGHSGARNTPLPGTKPAGILIWTPRACRTEILFYYLERTSLKVFYSIPNTLCLSWEMICPWYSYERRDETGKANQLRYSISPPQRLPSTDSPHSIICPKLIGELGKERRDVICNFKLINF